MMKLIETAYAGRYNSSTQTPLSSEPIKIDLKFGPIDLLMASYGSCMLATVDFYARKANFEVSNSKSELSYEMHADGDKVGKIDIKIIFSTSHTPEQKEIMETAAKKHCHVGNSLNPEIVRNYQFIYGN